VIFISKLLLHRRRWIELRCDARMMWRIPNRIFADFCYTEGFSRRTIFFCTCGGGRGDFLSSVAHFEQGMGEKSGIVVYMMV
jgi:hypothetical protein